MESKRETLSLKEDPTKDIEFGKPSDIPQIVALAMAAYKDTNLAESAAPPNTSDVIEEVSDMVFDGVVLIKRNKTNKKLIDGVMCFSYGNLWWNKEKPVLTQKFMYIVPKQRSVKVLLQFMKGLEVFSETERIPSLFTIVGNRKEKFEKILRQRFGYEEISKSLIKV